MFGRKKQDSNFYIVFELLFWGAIISTFIILINFVKNDYVTYSWFRLSIIDGLVEEIKKGNIPQFLGKPEHSWGFMLYIPYVCLFLKKDAFHTLLFLHGLLSWILFFLYPLLNYKICKNKNIAILSPVILYVFCGNFLIGYKIDTIWASGWCTALALPFLLLLYEEENDKQIWKYSIIIGVIASFANVFRNQCGFIVLCMFIAVVIQKSIKAQRIKVKDIFLLIIFFVIYDLLATTIPFCIGLLLDRDIIDNAGMVWHTLVTGLGLYDNPYGLEWKDDVTYRLVAEKFGESIMYSDKYLSACKQYFFYVVRTTPWFVFKTYAKKTVQCMVGVMHYEFTTVDDMYLYGRLMFTNINIPVVAFISSFVTSRICKNGFNLKRAKYKKMINQCCCGLIFVMLGCIQGIIADASVRYFMPGCVCFGLLFYYFVFDYLIEFLSYNASCSTH
ncbi:hypothetical protein [Pseudobutyrivibrio xylanivorans]|uniref:Dolichyl-phosphate-mannose-protein mannosyltransferase n=1 Tax=Pseudobutyrivibrio xylanivorans DSM 14809 TaxID=1123012 RepID=A0A1M6KP15_PSEXY|nr:hypothetical protein [Pseudobutyrivibrio xylanivorans]SHJ60622.1 hypothetical protein SAMN02745725_02908 [Pseudobutyrivibrio xylanivorans DSM 14809]